MAKKKVPSPEDVLFQFMVDYDLNVNQLSQATNIGPGTIRTIIKGKSKISLQTAFKLAKLFGVTVQFWTDLQQAYDIYMLQQDEDFQEDLSKIVKLKKPKAAAPGKTPPAVQKRGRAAKSSGNEKATAPRRGRPAKSASPSTSSRTKQAASARRPRAKKQPASGGSSSSEVDPGTSQIEPEFVRTLDFFPPPETLHETSAEIAKEEVSIETVTEEEVQSGISIENTIEEEAQSEALDEVSSESETSQVQEPPEQTDLFNEFGS
jgi:addiction module HigA family antidote